MQPRGRDGQVAAQPVDVLHERHVHLQGPLPGGLVCVPDVDAGTPGGGERQGGAAAAGGLLGSSAATSQLREDLYKTALPPRHFLVLSQGADCSGTACPEGKAPF